MTLASVPAPFTTGMSGAFRTAVAIAAPAGRRRRHVFWTSRRPRGISGGSGEASTGDALRARVRAALASGALPPLPGPRSWVGRGSGHPCDGCGEPLQSADLEHEVESPARSQPIRVHMKCYLIWKAES